MGDGKRLLQHAGRQAPGSPSTPARRPVVCQTRLSRQQQPRRLHSQPPGLFYCASLAPKLAEHSHDARDRGRTNTLIAGPPKSLGTRPPAESGSRLSRGAIAEIIDRHNSIRLHSALSFLRPVDYYRGNPEALLAERRRKLQAARELRKQENIKLRQRLIPWTVGQTLSYPRAPVVSFD